MSSRAFKNYIKFIMSGHKIEDYIIKYKIAINYDMAIHQLDAIEELTNVNGIVNKDTFYDTIKDFSFLDNSRTVDGEYHEEVYKLDGKLAENMNLSNDLNFELDETVEKILNVPILVKSKFVNDGYKRGRLGRIISAKFNPKISLNYNKDIYDTAHLYIDEEYPNGKRNFLQLPMYEQEECKYSSMSYKYTFGVLVYLEKADEVCPICYSQSRIPHIILDNFRIMWDGAGIITMESEL